MKSIERRPSRPDFLRTIVLAAMLVGGPPLLLRDRSPEAVQPVPTPAAEPTSTRAEDSSFRPRSSGKLQKRYGLSLDTTRSADV